MRRFRTTHSKSSFCTEKMKCRLWMNTHWKFLAGALLAVFGLTPFAYCDDVDYLKQIKPVLKERCFACHGSLKQESDLRLDTGNLIRKGGDSGPAIVPGKPNLSLLLERIASKDDSERMPPEGKPLTAKQIEIFRKWVLEGAKTPASEQAEKDPREHWAFKKPIRSKVPLMENGKPYLNPIDGFLSQQYLQHQLLPQPAAHKHVILRRVYLDLIGVPPTREELHAFLNDQSSTAYEKVVDRLLADPRYGERWARHWMDVWRYSDWYGRRDVPDVSNSAPQVWRWRDWIVKSLNQDHGYNRMVQEMLAGDEIAPEDDEAGYATGYLIRNWYALNPNDWMRNTVEHTGKAFLGLTFNCAHCHDHKYDPITHDDYFRIRAFFEPMYIRQDQVPGEADPGRFEDYKYGVIRKIQQLGAVRVFDKSPKAPTWFYTGGDERNRIKERGSISPGVPDFLAASFPKIKSVQLPPRAWYPGLRPAIQKSVLNEATQSLKQAEQELVVAKKSASKPSEELLQQLARAETEYTEAVKQAKQSGESGALTGRQSLLFDATAGRRNVLHKLEQLKKLEDGSHVEFQLQIIKDSHFNFQFVKNIPKKLSSGFVAFEKGRILAYKPGTFTQFEAGRFDLAAGENRFHVKLVIQTKADQCLFSVRLLPEGKTLVDNVPVALNKWNPVGDPTKSIAFDARSGSVVVIDEVIFSGPVSGNTAPVVHSDFESPLFSDGKDIVGIGGWINSNANISPAFSVVSQIAGNQSLQNLKAKWNQIQRAVRIPTLPLLESEAKVTAARKKIAGIEARIAADQVKYQHKSDADLTTLIQRASLLEREAAFQISQANVLTAERELAAAEAKPSKDAKRKKEIETANKKLATARTELEKTRQRLADQSQADKYTAFSLVYPQTSTGRRKAFAEWVTGRENPLTARVAVNHIWMRHFHMPLVASIYDFGRNGKEPTHPVLLDWLAVEFMESGWSMKHLHRLIVTSDAYRRKSSSKGATKWVAVDSENKLLWRMNPGRMEVEVIRDSLLYCGGKLDQKMGGPVLENRQSLTTHRRSLYYSVYPEQGGKSSLGELFDGPDAVDCYRRTRTVIPQQALALTNSSIVHEMSTAIVADWEKSFVGKSGLKEEKQVLAKQFIVASFEKILSRTPKDAELAVCLKAFQDQWKNPKDNSKNAETRIRESIVRTLINHNDFVTVR